MKNILFLLLVPALLCAATLQEKVDDKLHQMYGDSVEASFSKYEIPEDLQKKISNQSKQGFRKSFVYLWTITQPNGQKHMALVDQVKAKSAYITALIIVDHHQVVKELTILDYKGQHGRGVRDTQWLSQFSGLSLNSNPSNELDAVSGATFSSMALFKGVKKWLLLLDSLEHAANL